MARKLTKCADCHEASPDIIVSFGTDRTLTAEISVVGAARGSTPFNIRQMVREEFEIAGLPIGQPGTGNTRIKLDLVIREPTDPLIGPDSKQTILQGECRLRILHDGKVATDKTIQSRALRDMERTAAEDEIVSYLIQTACQLGLRALEEE
jgi:hypothetical protein